MNYPYNFIILSYSDCQGVVSVKRITRLGCSGLSEQSHGLNGKLLNEELTPRVKALETND